VVEGGQEEGAELAFVLVGAGQQVLADDLVGDEALDEVGDAVVGQAFLKEVGFEGGPVAFEESAEGVAAALLVEPAGEGDQGPARGGEGAGGFGGVVGHGNKDKCNVTRPNGENRGASSGFDT
jgi:hypothetical protein